MTRSDLTDRRRAESARPVDHSTTHPAPHAAGEVAYINLWRGMLAFYARRGMWADGAPRGMLAAWLGQPCPWSGNGAAVHWVSPEGMRALYADAVAAPPQAWENHHQKAQFLRRLREKALRAGYPPPWGDLPAEDSRQVPTPPTPPTPRAPVPFQWLTCPPPGSRPHAAFVEHIHRATRDLVELTQSSAYAQGDAT